MPQACTTNKRLPKRPAFSIHPTDHSKFANRLGGVSSKGRSRPGKFTIAELVAIIIFLSYDECLLRGIALTGFLKEMALRDPFLAHSIVSWYRSKEEGRALPTTVATSKLERMAAAATNDSFENAVRRIMGSLGVMDLSLKREFYKAHDRAIERFLEKSLNSPEIIQREIGSDIDWVVYSGRHGNRKPQKPGEEET